MPVPSHRLTQFHKQNWPEFLRPPPLCPQNRACSKSNSLTETTNASGLLVVQIGDGVAKKYDHYNCHSDLNRFTILSRRHVGKGESSGRTDAGADPR